MVRKVLIPIAALLLAFHLSSCLSLVDRKSLARDYAALGEGFFQIKQYEKAEGFFSRASELDPKLPLNSFLLAKTFAENGQWDRALSLTNGLLAKEAENAVFLSLKGYILQKQGKTGEARACLEKALEISPYSRDALFNMGAIEFSAGEFEKAYHAWERLVGIDPKDSEATLFLAKAAFRSERDDAGFRHLDDYAALKPDDASALRIRAERRKARREYSLALQAYEDLVAKDPKRAEDWFELSMLAMQAAEDADRSLEALGKAIELGFKDQEKIQAFVNSVAVGQRESFKALVEEGKAKAAQAGSGAAATGAEKGGEQARQ